jgi:hypothetical protein
MLEKQVGALASSPGGPLFVVFGGSVLSLSASNSDFRRTESKRNNTMIGNRKEFKNPTLSKRERVGHPQEPSQPFRRGQSATGRIRKGGPPALNDIIHDTMVGFAAGASSATVGAVVAGNGGGPVGGGAAAGATNQIVTDTLNGRPPNVVNVGASAVTGAVAGGIAGQVLPNLPGAQPDLLGQTNVPDELPKSVQIADRSLLGRLAGLGLSGLKSLLLPSSASASSLGGRKSLVILPYIEN